MGGAASKGWERQPPHASTVKLKAVMWKAEVKAAKATESNKAAGKVKRTISRRKSGKATNKMQKAKTVEQNSQKQTQTEEGAGPGLVGHHGACEVGKALVLVPSSG